MRAFTCYVNISINKLLTEPVCICFVNRRSGQGGVKTLLLRLLEKHLFLPALCPSHLHSLSLGELVASALFGLPVLQHLCAGLMLCCDCLVRVTSPKSDRAIECLLRERGAVFSHTLLCPFQFSEAYLGAGKTPKNTYSSFVHV